MSEKRILCIGLVCVDVIQICKEYPKEDSDQRSVDHRWQRGGNASNNCTVLTRCGQTCEFFGTIGDDLMAKFAKQDFKTYNIIAENVVTYHNQDCPFSTVLINEKNGSRTIIHSNKNMPELELADFRKLDLKKYCWIHFEGRNVKEISKMLEDIRNWNSKNPPITTSVELEKPKEELTMLLNLADYIFLGKDFASKQGCQSKHEALSKNIGSVKAGAVLIVAWGESGAIACRTENDPVESPAFPPRNVVDTLGAGDTFVATSILCLSKGLSLKDSLTAACKLAGAKVAMSGFSEINSDLLRVLNIYIS